MNGSAASIVRVCARWTMVLGVSIAGAAPAQDLMSMLEEGPVVSVKQGKDGSFEQCTAVVHIEATPEEVWAVLVDFEAYTEFMPKLRRAELNESTDTTALVSLEIETPGRNTRYVMAYSMRESEKVMSARWRSGDLRGTFGEWRLVEAAGGTLAYYTGATRNYSRILQALEDEQQTITVGVNVSSAIAMVRAVKERAERTRAVTAGG